MKLSAKQRRLAAVNARPVPAPANDAPAHVPGTFTEMSPSAFAQALAEAQLRERTGILQQRAERYMWQQVSLYNPRLDDLEERVVTSTRIPSYETVWDPDRQQHIIRQVSP